MGFHGEDFNAIIICGLCYFIVFLIFAGNSFFPEPLNFLELCATQFS